MEPHEVGLSLFEGQGDHRQKRDEVADWALRHIHALGAEARGGGAPEKTDARANAGLYGVSGSASRIGEPPALLSAARLVGPSGGVGWRGFGVPARAKRSGEVAEAVGGDGSPEAAALDLQSAPAGVGVNRVNAPRIAVPAASNSGERGVAAQLGRDRATEVLAGPRISLLPPEMSPAANMALSVTAGAFSAPRRVGPSFDLRSDEIRGAFEVSGIGERPSGDARVRSPVLGPVLSGLSIFKGGAETPKVSLAEGPASGLDELLSEVRKSWAGSSVGSVMAVPVGPTPIAGVERIAGLDSGGGLLGSIAAGLNLTRPGQVMERSGVSAAEQYRAPSTAPRESGAERGGGVVMLDGRLVGQWLTDRMGRDAARPNAGMTGFNTRQGAAWSPSGVM